MSQKSSDIVRESVRDSYTRVAEANENGKNHGVASGCCGVSSESGINAIVSSRLGYSESDCCNIPAGADMGLGCGNPRAIADLKPGEVVLDLGSGGGFDAFLAAREVGEDGQVIGVDMTPAMVSKARAIALDADFQNVEFRLGEIEHLPVADDSIDVIISNCVINLSPNKPQVFREAFRVLRPGGRLAISDVVASVELPDQMRNDQELYSACIAGASTIDILYEIIRSAGFDDVLISPKDESRDFIKDWAPGRGVEDYVLSAVIEATKPH